jgi:hypothetical protein
MVGKTVTFRTELEIYTYAQHKRENKEYGLVYLSRLD